LLDEFNALVLEFAKTAESVKMLEESPKAPELGPLYVRFHRMIRAVGERVYVLRKAQLVTWDRPSISLFLVRLVVVHAATKSYRQLNLVRAALVALVRLGHPFARNHVLPQIPEGGRREILELVDFDLATYAAAGSRTLERSCTRCDDVIRIKRPADCDFCKKPLEPVGSRAGQRSSDAAPNVFAWACPGCDRQTSVPLVHLDCGGELPNPPSVAMRQRHFRALNAVRGLVP